MDNLKQKGMLMIASLSLITGCIQKPTEEIASVELNRTGGVQITDEIDQPELIMEGLQVIDDAGIAYGIDFKRRLPYKLALKNGAFRFLASPGAGPKELSQPSLISVKKVNELYVFDTALDQIVHIIDTDVVEKIGGYARHGVWLRHMYGLYWNGHLITSIKEPEKINSLDFENSRPIAILNLSDNTLVKHGTFSPTLDIIDTLQKYPVLTIDKNSATVYYIFRSDYTVMKLDLKSGYSSIASSYKPRPMRVRTIPFDHNNAYHYSIQFSKELNEDRTQLAGIDILDDRLVVIHQNTHADFFENRDVKFIDYFGVVYDLPDLANPREFTLPGKFLGTWGSRLLIEENDDIMEYTIGFYEFAE